MSVGPLQIILVVLLALVFFGRGRISEMMGDVGKGISSFKKGLADENEAIKPAPRIEAAPTTIEVEAEKTPDNKA